MASVSYRIATIIDTRRTISADWKIAESAVKTIKTRAMDQWKALCSNAVN